MMLVLTGLAGLALGFTVRDLKDLGIYHCKEFPLEDLLALSKGNLSARHGIRFLEMDQYIRKFVGRDRIYTAQDFVADEFQDDQYGDETQEQEKEQAVDPDWSVPLYLQGLKECGLSWSQQDVYSVWRLYRFMVNHDYFYEWLRGKIRGLTGYESLRDSSIMDTDYRSGQRFKIEKVISIDEYERMETTYYSPAVAVLIDFVKATSVLLLNGNYTRDAKPLLYFSLDADRVLPSPFTAMNFSMDVKGKLCEFAGVTLPGVPLVIAGRSKGFAWAFSGFKVDRTNIQKREVFKGRYYNEQKQAWVRVKNSTHQIPVFKLEQPYKFWFIESEYGPFFTKDLPSDKKALELKVVWQDQPRVRRLFADVFEMAAESAVPNKTLEFPFAGLFIASGKDIAAIFCQPHRPLSFIYPELSVQTSKIKNVRVINPEKGFIVAHNEHFSAPSFKGYINGKAHHWKDEAVAQLAKDWKFRKVTPEQVVNSLSELANPLFKRRFEHMLIWYRRYKHSFFEGQSWRKEMDVLLAEMSKFDSRFRKEDRASLRVLVWDWFFKEQMFTSLSDRTEVLRLIRHRLLTEEYYTNSFQLWDKTSFGECNTTEYVFDYQLAMNYQEHNSSCVYNLMHALNLTYTFLKERGNGTLATFLMEEHLSLHDLLSGAHRPDTQEHRTFSLIFKTRQTRAVQLLAFGEEGMHLTAGSKKVKQPPR